MTSGTVQPAALSAALPARIPACVPPLDEVNTTVEGVTCWPAHCSTSSTKPAAYPQRTDGSAAADRNGVRLQSLIGELVGQGLARNFQFAPVTLSGACEVQLRPKQRRQQLVTSSHLWSVTRPKSDVLPCQVEPPLQRSFDSDWTERPAPTVTKRAGTGAAEHPHTKTPACGPCCHHHRGRSSHLFSSKVGRRHRRSGPAPMLSEFARERLCRGARNIDVMLGTHANDHGLEPTTKR